MGHSYGHLAGMRRQQIENFCRAQTDSSNCYHVGDESYMIEFSNRSHRDGAITATIYRYTSDTTVKKSGSLRIEGDGTISRGPAVLRCLRWLFVKINNQNHGVWLEKFGQPTHESLLKYIEEYEASFRKGGVNYHVSLAEGKLTFVNKAQIIDGDTGLAVVEWVAPPFRIVA